MQPNMEQVWYTAQKDALNVATKDINTHVSLNAVAVQQQAWWQTQRGILMTL